MVELGYLEYGGTLMSRTSWNCDIEDMVELGYLGYGGTRVSMIWWNYDI